MSKLFTVSIDHTGDGEILAVSLGRSKESISLRLFSLSADIFLTDKSPSSHHYLL